MVQKWKKDLDTISKTLKNINFDLILNDIKSRKYQDYDKKQLFGYKDLYRIRLGRYRIIFKDIHGEEIKIISIKNRGNVYKGLK